MMRIRFSVFVLALAGCMSGSDEPSDISADLAAIRELHDADVAGVLAGDMDALLALWSDDPMALPPEGEILVGREAIAAMLGAFEGTADRPWETVEYSQDFNEVMVNGDYAWDLGTVRTRMVHKATGRELTLDGKLLRILKRQPDGTWRVHRSAWNSRAPVISEPEGG